MESIYRIDRARGGKKDDPSVERSLRGAYIRPGSSLTIQLDRISPWNGRDKVEILDDCVIFHNCKTHNFSPKAIKAAVRVLYKYGHRGPFQISVKGDLLTIQPYTSAYTISTQ
jgi:hypothetical protein